MQNQPRFIHLFRGLFLSLSQQTGTLTVAGAESGWVGGWVGGGVSSSLTGSAGVGG